MSPDSKFSDDVDAAPVASPGRTDKNPAAVGATTVTFNNTPVAPAGTAVPVTCNFCEIADTNGPGRPMLTGSRVSKMRIGSIVITDDGALDAALTATIPPPPRVTATAAPTAAQRDLHKPRRRPATDPMTPPSVYGQPPQVAAQAYSLLHRTSRVECRPPRPTQSSRSVRLGSTGHSTHVPESSSESRCSNCRAGCLHRQLGVRHRLAAETYRRLLRLVWPLLGGPAPLPFGNCASDRLS